MPQQVEGNDRTGRLPPTTSESLSGPGAGLDMVGGPTSGAFDVLHEAQTRRGRARARPLIHFQYRAVGQARRVASSGLMVPRMASHSGELTP